MFLSQLLTFEDRQKLLKLNGWKIIEVSPKYLESSKSVALVRHVRTKYGAREQVQNYFFPRIRPQTVLRMYRDLRRGQRGVLLEQLSILFELGLGVPKHKQLAEFISQLDRVDDQADAIKYIGKIIKHYIAQYKLSMGAQNEYMYCAAYTEQLMTMKKFVGKLKPETKKAMTAPKGIPAVMLYSLTDHNTAKFSLVDGYAFSETNFPIPISPTVLRSEFKAVPRHFNSFSLRKSGQYILVFGILYWPDENEKNFHHAKFLDSDDYEVLVDSFDEYCSKELLAAREFRTYDRDEHPKHKHAVEVLAKKSDPSRKELLRIKEANAYFEQRQEQWKKLARLERKSVSALKTDGPVASANFFPLDIGAMGVTRKIRSLVNIEPKKLQASLNAWGFNTEIVSGCPTQRIYYGVNLKRRSWQIDMEKK